VQLSSSGEQDYLFVSTTSVGTRCYVDVLEQDASNFSLR
jgi:hypothetical protein